MKLPQRIAGFLEMQKPEGLLDKLNMLPKLGELVRSFPRRFPRPVQGSDPAQRLLTRLLPYPALLARRWRPLHHACRWCFRIIRKPANVIAACIACRSSMARPPACTGRSTNKARSTIGVLSPKASRAECRSLWPSVPIRLRFFRHPAASAQHRRNDVLRIPARQVRSKW